MGLHARYVVEGYLVGNHKSPFHGFSIEFTQHREYVPGDDLRHLDWKVLGRSDRPLYGYEIAKRLERDGEAPVAGKQSALYPVLRNLHAAGLLESFVEPSVAGPPRRYYQATALGRAVLDEWTKAWRATRAFVDDALAGATP